MVESQLFQVIRYFLNNDPVTEELDWQKLLKFAEKHSLAQFVYLYMNHLPKGQRPDAEMQRCIVRSHSYIVAKQISQNAAIEDIHSALEENGCFHLFFKGSVTRKRYKDPFWRSMSDIDFLYQESQHKIVKKALLEKEFSGYVEGRKNDTYYCLPHVCVEAHRQLVPSNSSYYSYCAKVWERAHLAEGCKYLYEMGVEDELIFNIIHLAIHFLEGGAGIRFILDVYVYNQLEIDFQYVEHELSEIDLLDFYKNISVLAENWFGSGEKNELSEKLADFILENGTFGTSENSSALAVSEGRLRYLRRMCFPGYEEMTSIYPWLNGKAILLPFAWVRRGVGVLTQKTEKLNAQIIKTKQGDRKLGKELHRFYRECGLRGTL
jgi:hypothetical protein